MLHKFIFEDSKIVMDVYSGAIHIVEDVVYDIVDDYQQKTKQEIINQYKNKYEERVILEALEEIQELIDNEMLFVEDVYEDIVPSYENRNPVVKALCLHIAHDCNLTCKYCFAEEGEYHGKRSLMTAEVGKASIDFVIANSGSRHNIEIDFFGGEPLMNFEVVKEIVEYAKSKEKEHNKNFRFTITTNGVLLDKEKQDFINEHMYNIVLSIDGRKSVNDRMRKTKTVKGSYDIIMPKFKEMAESRNHKGYYVRGTFTRNNLDFGNDVLHLADEGFKEISVEPVVAPSDVDYALQEEDIEGLLVEYETLAREMLKREKDGNGFNLFHFMVDLSQGPCAYKRLTGCGAGTEYLAVTPGGDLYPCHQFVGVEDFIMGDVFKGVENKEIGRDFEDCNVYNNDECKECWAKFYCSGGCPANSYNTHGDLNENYSIGCQLQKKQIECAIGMKAEMLKD